MNFKCIIRFQFFFLGMVYTLIEGPKRESLYREYHKSSPDYVHGDDHCLLLEQPVYVVLPNVMRQIVHSHVEIVTFFNSVEANVSNSVQFLAKTVGKIRNGICGRPNGMALGQTVGMVRESLFKEFY